MVVVVDGSLLLVNCSKYRSASRKLLNSSATLEAEAWLVKCSIAGRTDISSMIDRQASSNWRSQLLLLLFWLFPLLLFFLDDEDDLFRIRFVFLVRPRPSRFFFSWLSSNVLSKAGSSRQKPPLPGSSFDRGILMKHLFRERLCRIEFCKEKYQN